MLLLIPPIYLDITFKCSSGHKLFKRKLSVGDGNKDKVETAHIFSAEYFYEIVSSISSSFQVKDIFKVTVS
jgi:hypothetical protein